MNLNEIIQAAQGGQGVANLGAQYGLTPEQTQAAVQALMPAFSTALQKITSDPSSLAGVLGHLASGVHQGAFTGADPAAAAANGGDALNQIFGNSADRLADRRSRLERHRRRRERDRADDAGGRLDAARRPRPFADRAGLRRRARAIGRRRAGPGGRRRGGRRPRRDCRRSGRQPVRRRPGGPGGVEPRPSRPQRADRHAGSRAWRRRPSASRGSTASCNR